MHHIRIAENAGFCFGVRRATGMLEEALKTKARLIGSTPSDILSTTRCTLTTSPHAGLSALRTLILTECFVMCKVDSG